MDRKKTILIAVMINAGLLGVLLIAALTTQEEIVAPASTLAGDLSPQLPQFDEALLSSRELPILAESPKPLELPIAVVEEPSTIHQLPPLVPEVAPAAPIAPVTSVAAAPSAAPSFNEVVVKKGDNLEKIAKAHRTSVDEIIKLNHLPSSFLKVGQVLKIPAERFLAAAAKPAEKKPLELGPEYYTMRVGDNPWAIAMKHHMKVEELLRLNGLNEERARKLKPGDRLRIR
jgi:LysM repeat protein